LFFTLLTFTFADLPVHCIHETLIGTWTFTLGNNNKYVNCTTFSSIGTYTVTLKDPSTAVDSSGNQGFWTVVYDQGFEVQIGGKKYFAFSYFEEHSGKAISYCDKTFNGWYHNSDGSNWGCYYARKNSNIKIIEKVTLSTIDLDKPFLPDYELVNKINSVQNLWEATVYPEFNGFKIRDLQRRAGLPIRLNPFPKTKKVMQTRDNDFPTFWDWRNASSVNFVPDVRDQASCGSCYAFGTLGMLESRIRIKTQNQDKVILSPQEIVSCSEYAQGCDGGFPYLVEKTGEDFGIVPESCFTYTAFNSPCSKRCHDFESQKRYFTNYAYIGGYYGACNEQAMLQELYQNGPIVVGFQVYNDFFAYRKGIYFHTKLKSNINAWEETNHAVFAVGWGIENGVKYWIVQNSWGKSWGENGYFRIKRGNDECAFESMASHANPK